MRIRDAVLEYQITRTANSGTITIDLDIVDPVSALGFEFEATNGTTFNQNNPLSRCITKIEVVSGSSVLSSLSFEEAQALQFYKTGKQPQLRETENPSGGDVIGCMILFGRHLYDELYALDLSNIKNPQLKITYDLATTKAVSATEAFATGTFKYSAWAKVMEEIAAPSQFMMAKELHSWTSGTSGDRRKELPTDYVYHLAMLRSYVSGNDINENISRLKLSCDTDKFIPYDRYVKQFDAEMAQLFGNVVVWKKAFATNGDTVWLPVNKEPQVQGFLNGNASLSGYICQFNYIWSGIASLIVSNAAGTAYTSDARIDMLIEGHALHATLPIPFGRLDKPEDWFDPRNYRKVEMVMTEAAAAANQIVLEQVAPVADFAR